MVTVAVSRPAATGAGDTEGAAPAEAVELDDSVFGIAPNLPCLHQVVKAQLAAARRGTQSTKTRAEVSGGGKKPFKQKGTGRARQGSERAPQFSGGGVALGPKPRSYRQRTPRKMIALALRSALSDRAAEGKVKVVAGWPWAEPSTRAAKEALAALDVPGKVLVVLSRQDQVAARSFRNLRDIQVILRGELNAYDVLVNDWVVFTRDTLPGTAAPAPAPAALSPTPPAGAAPDAPPEVAP
ncbi:MAG: 50S ribosomal protein L4 [Acidimicrobiales bacterium]